MSVEEKQIEHFFDAEGAARAMKSRSILPLIETDYPHVASYIRQMTAEACAGKINASGVSLQGTLASHKGDEIEPNGCQSQST